MRLSASRPNNPGGSLLLAPVKPWDVERFLVPDKAAAVIRKFILALGEERREAVVFLAGRSGSGKTEAILDTIGIPNQLSSPADEGCFLLVPGESFSRVGAKVAELGRTLYGQLHSHPGLAYHSPADERNVFVRFAGGLSIVVPHFGRHAFLDPAGSVAYRFNLEAGKWMRYSPQQFDRMILIEGDDEVVIVDAAI